MDMFALIPSSALPGMKTLSACRHLPHKGGERLDARSSLHSFARRVPRVKSLPLVGRGWGGVFMEAIR